MHIAGGDGHKGPRELFLDSRWKLGQLLAKMPRSKPGPKGKDISRAGKHLDSLERLGLDKNRAQEALRGKERPPGRRAPRQRLSMDARH
jgi:hypothetical protein